MHLGLRLLFAFLAITGVAAFFVLRVFVTEIKPSVSEVMEDLMVDTANLLAEVAAPELLRLPAGGTPAEDGALAAAVRAYRGRTVSVQIWGLHKTTLDLRVLLTDAGGRVVFDSGTPSAVGEDYSHWRDVTRTLRGEYGARTSRETGHAGADDPAPVMFVAAPVLHEGRILGALVVAKPIASIAPFVERAERKVLLAGVLLLGLSLVIGVAVTLWTVHSVRQLRRYALAAGDTSGARRETPQPPALPGELGELAQAMGQMRQRLLGREQLEQRVRALTHELKSPLAAIQGAAELLQEPLADADRLRFARQVGEQSERLHQLVRQMLELSKVEGLQSPPAMQAVDWAALTEGVLADHAAALEQRGLAWAWTTPPGAHTVKADAALLRLALSNVLANAMAHAPAGSALSLTLHAEGAQACWTLRDGGPGVPGFAMQRLGERFFTAPAEGGGTRGSGLGLAIVREVMALHGGELAFADAAPGLAVTLRLPLA